MLGLDKLGRILISEDFRKVHNFDQREVHIYYSEEIGRFYILPTKDETKYWLSSRPLDEKGRFSLPKDILKVYNTKNVLLLQKDGILYVVPFKEE